MWKGKFSSQNHYAEDINLAQQVSELSQKARTVSKDDALEVRLYNVGKFDNKKIPKEVHETTVQYIIVQQGKAMVTIKEEGKEETKLLLKEGHMTIIPMNSAHEITQYGDTELKLISIYSERK